MTDSLCCTPETNSTWYVSYTPRKTQKTKNHSNSPTVSVRIKGDDADKKFSQPGHRIRLDKLFLFLPSSGYFESSCLSRFSQGSMGAAVGSLGTAGQTLETQQPICINILSSAGSHLHTCSLICSLNSPPANLLGSFQKTASPTPLSRPSTGVDLRPPRCRCTCDPGAGAIALQGGPGEEHCPAEKHSLPCARRTAVPPRHSWRSWTPWPGSLLWRHPSVHTAQTDAHSDHVPAVESGVQLESFHHRLAADQLVS